MITLGLVVNASARRVKRRLGRTPFWSTRLPTRLVRITRNLEELDSAIDAFRGEGVGAVAVLGGDGSVHHLVDAVLRRYPESEAPLLLALPGGTMNGVARALGTGGAPERVFHAALAVLAAEAPSIAVHPVLRIEDRHAGCIRHGFGFATGLVYRAFEEYYRAPVPGLTDAVRASLRPFIAALLGGSFYVGVQLDVRSSDSLWLPEPAHSLVASVLDQPLLWFRPFGAGLGDTTAFHLAATSMRPHEIAWRLWSIFRGRCRHPRLRVDHSQDATVHGNIGYLIDGDLYPGGGVTDVRLTVGPRLRFLVPTPSRPEGATRGAAADTARAMTTKR